MPEVYPVGLGVTLACILIWFHHVQYLVMPGCD